MPRPVKPLAKERRKIVLKWRGAQWIHRPQASTLASAIESEWESAMASNKGGWLYLFLAGPILIGAAYSISALLTADNAAGEKGPSELSLAFDLLLWVGAPIAIVAALPLLAGIIKVLKKS